MPVVRKYYRRSPLRDFEVRRVPHRLDFVCVRSAGELDELSEA